MNIFAFTILESKANYNSQIRKLVISYQCQYEEIQTKDGLIFSIDFPNDEQRIKFKKELSLKFSGLYI